MRIAVVTTSYPRDEADPAGHFVRAEVLQSERAGHRVTVITPPQGGAFGWPGAAARIRENPLRAWSAARWVACAAREIRKGGFDRVVAHWAIPSAWPIVVGGETFQLDRDARPPPPLDVVSHGADVRLLLRLPSPLRRALVERVARRASTWRFVSEPLRDALLASLPPALARRIPARVAPSPIELPEVRDEAQRLRASLATSGLVAVTVGRLVPSKRVDRVLEHAARVRPGALVIVGDGPERGRLEAMARHLGVHARFVGLRPRAEALAWIRAADVLWHASVAEGLSTVVREAEALGTRVEWLGQAAEV